MLCCMLLYRHASVCMILCCGKLFDGVVNRLVMYVLILCCCVLNWIVLCCRLVLLCCELNCLLVCIVLY